ncbi:hypothetical protein a10_08479 [Streptomyces acidiscabies]|nr:hypothetical protein a10_08479 [Streptomyces acidiscabies]
MQEPGQQQSGEREVPEVIDAELRLEAVHGGAVRHGHHARVVDEQVELVVREAVREAVYGAQVAEVEEADLGFRAGHLAPQPFGSRFPPRFTPARQDDVRPLARQLARGDVPEAAVGPGDHRHTALLIRNLPRAPAAHGPLLPPQVVIYPP